MWNDYCFVCSRRTDHVGEHDALVDAGQAEYDDGVVLKTAAWNDHYARVIAEIDYFNYKAEFGF